MGVAIVTQPLYSCRGARPALSERRESKGLP